MKQKMKEHKGITLVALILTIIILLILAVVAISAVKGDGIIAHAKNARELYAAKSEEENALLQNYLEQLNNWKNEETKAKYVFTLGNNTYEAEEGMTWRQWVNSKYNTIGMKITTKPSKYGISSGGYCIAYTGTDKFENAYKDFAIRALATTTEIITIKGEHTENGKDCFDILAIVNKRSDSWVDFSRRQHNRTTKRC